MSQHGSVAIRVLSHNDDGIVAIGPLPRIPLVRQSIRGIGHHAQVGPRAITAFEIQFRTREMLQAIRDKQADGLYAP